MKYRPTSIGIVLFVKVWENNSSVATGGHGGHVPPNPSPAWSWELPKSEEKKWVWVGVPDHLGQTSWRIIMSKL